MNDKPLAKLLELVVSSLVFLRPLNDRSSI